MDEFTIHSVQDSLETSDTILAVPSKHQGHRTRFSFTDKYTNKYGAPIMNALSVVISAHPTTQRAVEFDAEIGDIVHWVAADGTTTTYEIVDDRPLHNPYLMPIMQFVEAKS